MSREFILYSRPDCPLCDDMLHALQTMDGTVDWRVRVVNVDSDPALARRYGMTIPVLVDAASGRVLSETVFDQVRFERLLSDCGVSFD